MFTLIFFLLLGIGAFIAYTGIRDKSKGKIALGIIFIGLVFFFFWFIDFWGEKLWFDALGYNDRFWTLFFFQLGFAVAGAFIAAILMLLLLISLPKSKRGLKFLAVAVGAVIGALWGYGNWSVFMKFWFQVDTQLTDPILGNEIGFYLFSLPFYDQLQGVLLFLAIIALITAFVTRFRLVEAGGTYQVYPESAFETGGYKAVFISGAVVLFILAAGKYLDRFHLMYSELGAASGPGWTDVNIKLPVLMIMVVITALAGILLLVPAGRNLIVKLLAKFQINAQASPGITVLTTTALVVLIWFLGLTALPGFFQNYRVEPNEITYEKPYIANNIEYTQYAFNLDKIEEREFPVVDTFTREMVRDNEMIFKNIRLWDWRALDAVLKQFQEIRLYYEFDDVDIDRYHFGDQYRQVMVSAREMNTDNLPTQSQTFVNKHFKYTHGYGIVLTTVTDFTPEGLPNLLVKNIPPVTEYPELEVTQPQIYYGELTDDYVIVNSSEQEFDYPMGDENVYISYPGTGGVQITGFWRKFIYSYKMGGTKLLFSSYPTENSRIMFKRQVKERAKTLAPFLELDGDPYIVNADGKLYWMIDAYTTSSYYPYSEPFSSQELVQYKEGEQTRRMQVQHDRDYEGINYIRNSVKIVVDAFNGDVDFYMFDEEDPLIQVWDKIFPGLLKRRAEMPDKLLEHVRYPVDYLLIQGLKYAKYHMEDPEVFYNQEDLWIRATENYYGQVVPVEPYYIMWEQPDSDEPEFSLILPFTPKNRQVSIGWIAGLSDPENYGRFISYSFPKDKRVLGPQQVETKIDQNSFLSGQLSLWDQRGSRVIRGNVLAIPVDNTLIYVEPIYLQAETAAYPELRLVIVMHDDNLSYAPTFEEALEGIFKDQPEIKEEKGEEERAIKQLAGTLIQQANKAFNNYIEETGKGNFGRASQSLEQLQEALEKLAKEAETQPGDTL
ncbi:MAG: UPF0182 family membrane protein [Candidatus Cyclobacteriaceae bacterium M2_1C_046]